MGWGCWGGEDWGGIVSFHAIHATGEDWGGLGSWRGGMSGAGMGSVRLVEVPGRRPPGRLKKNNEKELNRFQLCTVQTQDRSGWKTIIDCLTL